MNILTWDTETTTFQKGNAYSKQNKLVCIAYKWNDLPTKCIYVSEDEWKDTYLNQFKTYFEQADLHVLFNAKFDLTWVRRYGINISNIKLWDCQLHHFLHSNQLETYPSLDSVSGYYGLGSKLDVVANEYWAKGIDTANVPREILTEYAIKDVDLTYAVYQCQKDNFDSHQQRRLFSLQCQDLLVLQEMEWNGLNFDSIAALKDADIYQKEIDEIETKLHAYFNTTDMAINLSSRDHLSTLLYGGTISFEDRIPVGLYKTGVKEGQVRYKVVRWDVPFPRKAEPIQGSEMAKEGYYSTDLPTLKKLKGNKQFKDMIALLDRRSALSKLCNTYLKALSSLIIEMDWDKDTIHGQFNQVSVITGRLSSNKPNLQNLSSEVKNYIKSRLSNITPQHEKD